MNVLNLDGQAAACYDSFARLLIDNKAEIGMEDISNAELFTQAPAILRSLVRISIGALRAPEEPDNARRLAALEWFVEWASREIEGFPEAALSS